MVAVFSPSGPIEFSDEPHLWIISYPFRRVSRGGIYPPQ